MNKLRLIDKPMDDLGKGFVDGLLNVNKPAGIYTMDLVRRVKKVTRQKRVGHAGTLDPLATGVVPICFGRATRMVEYLVDDIRAYRTTLEFGIETDTYDADGLVVNKLSDFSVSLEDLEDAFKNFVGRVDQVPPMYSAIKVEGKRLYELARSGIKVERKPRKVQVNDINVVDWSPPFCTLEISCGRGFYVRSLVHDLGQILGCGAYVKELVRLIHGPFKISESISVDEIEQKVSDGTWQDLLFSPDVTVNYMKAATVSDELSEMIKHGQTIPSDPQYPFIESSEKYRVYNRDGKFIAVMSFNVSLGRWHSERVFI